ncbi:hypothetical protein NA56DRAFT_748626 [Hyaloscypha hepaticicola]|uniref:Cyanovirin-N domain-containing protein n=1 Tax=Hyaloscypha hepaticicola TaxID=2082293 RepID=A0A2J6Q5U7_9HELO|nr:hypothetical protein NA56DRAFT_748626 [Hyaloscypha hepaticicola]
MVSFTKTIASALACVGVVTATNLHVNNGCVIANNNALCASDGTLAVFGQTQIFACISQEGSQTFANCEFNQVIPTNWGDAYFGADNCVYSAGSNPIQVGCSVPISAMPVPNPY